LNVVIGDEIDDLYLKPFNISREKVIETVNKEDVRKPMNFGDYTIILYLKNFGKHYLLVDGRWKPISSTLVISAVYIVDQQIIHNIDANNPLAVLERFAEEFGYEIELGDQKSKFIHDSRIKIPTVDNIGDFTSLIKNSMRITDNGSTDIGSYLGDYLAKPEQFEENLYANIALAYFISIDKYTQYLKTKKFL
jgi:hypothetical protein